ncbi:alpha/beta hydrolase [Paenibacillus protaetiae]|uniref:Alpha/beta hydrolase n=1 Tax=Paenibacillus protaetiae TaxID=2509456 RepID=A0A4P6F4H8_9BACL|nr:alpha/beta hydrolase [Paenibacillus protaetiae]QAY68087.1 alpha/beta hydrolase [Paenibacillus protaetiae]
MRRNDWTLIAEDGTELYARSWHPGERTALLGAVCLVHGMGEHGERYARLAESLTAAGFAVFAHDQRGHGRTPGQRGHTPLEEAVSDACRLIGEARSQCEGVPVFLYGHSMGGNVALNCALRENPPIQGLILSSPWLRLASPPPAVQVWLGKQISRFAPRFTQSTRLKLQDLYRSGYTDSAAWHDLYNHTKITVSTYLAFHESGEWALHHADRLSCPLLLLHGTADRVVSYAASEELASRTERLCTFLSWEDNLHELHNDLDGESVAASVVFWLRTYL